MVRWTDKLVPVCFRRIVVFLAVCLLGQPSLAAEKGVVVDNPHYGEVLFQFFKQDYFTALTHVSAYRETQRVGSLEEQAELLQGGLMLSWGQHKEAGEIFERLLAESTDLGTRNRTWFYLGKVRYQRGYPEQAMAALESIDGMLPGELESERYDLLARIYMEQERFADAARVLSDWPGDDVWSAYARYNLGVAMVRMGDLDAGASLLGQVGTMSLPETERDEILGLRDRANLALGFAYLQSDLDGEARPVLQRVRLNGPFSNKALLGVGWADAAKGDFRKALVPWLELNDRERLDSAVQESFLAVPYAYSQLGVQPIAAQYYARALDIYTSEIVRLNAAISNVRSGKLVNALLANDDLTLGGWYWQLSELPLDDRARYLSFTIANQEFHEGLKSYRDLISLNRHLGEWRDKLVTFRDMLDTRILAYNEKMPAMQEKIDQFDLAAMQESYEMLSAHSVAASEDHDVLVFASAEEQFLWARLSAIEDSPGWSAISSEQKEKVRLLKGLLQWDMEKEFRVRSWRQSRSLEELGQDINDTRLQYESVAAATDSIAGTVREFDSRITLLQPHIEMLQGKLQASMQSYELYLRRLAEAELEDQRERMLNYQAQARYALASLYDQMSANDP